MKKLLLALFMSAFCVSLSAQEKSSDTKMISAVITLKKTDGTLLEGKELTVIQLDRATKKEIPVFSGKTNAKGQILLDKKLKSGIEDYYCLYGPKGKNGFVRLSTKVKADVITKVKADVSKLDKIVWVGPDKAPAVGDKAPDIALFDVVTGEVVKLSSYKDQVIYIDFWATWCGLCQRPMAQNNTWMKKNAAAWKDKAVILGVSAGDRDLKNLKAHIKNKKWNSMPQYWAKDDIPNEAPADMVYKIKIKSFPTAVMIDQSGKIVFRGNPGSHNGEEHINKLLKGEK